MRDAAEAARRIIDAKLYPLQSAADLELVKQRATLEAFTAAIQAASQPVSEQIGKLAAARGELRNADDAAEILRHVGAICAEFNLDLTTETATNES